MTLHAISHREARAAGPGDRSTLRAVAMPTEHGGWSLTLEPVVLGLLVAWSWPGLAIGAAAMLAFLARTPLKLVLVDRWRGRWLPRTSVAARVATVQILALAALVVLATFDADSRFWWPLLAAAPLVTIELWFDMRSRSRRLLPELAGTVGIGSVAAMIALADGADATLALGLWAVVAARASAAIPYARTQVFRARHRPHRLWHSDLAQIVAVAAVAVAWLPGAAPIASLVAIAAVATFNIGAVRAAPRPAKIVGLQQMLFGIAVIVVTAIAVPT
ncbi:YwiC-like family protein [Desertimonas flava]|jgi:hypothetical protein|uniref:YwiC-like family protein n=1 Tax=Desertimonas flava TaxID=2064846 RepID=UPI000E345E7E|nr:YwiC-like family protein [Desertimonas flava]